MFRGFLAVLVISAFAAIAGAGCAGKGVAIAPASGAAAAEAQTLTGTARDLAQASLQETNRGQARELAEEGIAKATRCLELAPEEAGCFYWRAVNTGLYHRVHVIGYQRGVKRMIDDCDKAIALDPGYDHAGPYRLLGILYTRLPQTGSTAESITRDLDAAEAFLRKAIELAPDYPENHLALAEALMAKGNASEARAHLALARHLSPRWKDDASYNDWSKMILALEKDLRKKER